jgi:uridine kinase
MDEHLSAFRAGANSIEKPLVIYAEDRITTETLDVKDANVLIAEGTYTTQLENVDMHVFIDRDFSDTKKHRERRIRHASELDSFIDRVLEIEHEIIAANKPKADIIVNKDYSVATAV